MALNTRRALLAAAAATLASGGMGRKPHAQQILTPQPDPPRVLGKLLPLESPAPLPAQGFTDAEGKPVSIADFAGKGVVLNLWATWCVPCVAEMPSLDALAQAVAADNIVVLPLSSDRGGISAVRKFYASHAIAHLGIWLDPFGAAARAWGARGLPTTLILDRQGNARAKLEGAADWTAPDTLAALRSFVG